MRHAGEVPVARRQLRHEPVRLVLALGGVTLAVALVGLLFGLREGIGQQVTTYAANADADVYIAGRDTRNLVSAGPPTLPAGLATKVQAQRGVAEAAPIISALGILRLHDKRVATLLIGAEPGRLGAPWAIVHGRAPRSDAEISVDRVMADAHGLGPGDVVTVRGRRLRIVGLTKRTSSWMTPIVFVTRRAAAAMQGRSDTATFVLVKAQGVEPGELAARLRSRFPRFEVLTRKRLEANDRELMAASFNAPLLVMVVIALAVGALVIAITTYGFVAERRREFGALKAIGARNLRLYRLVCVQALAIALTGLATGVLLQRGAASVIEAVWPKFLFVTLPEHYALTAAAALVMGLAGALVPARIVAALDPSEVFRR